MFQQLTEKQMTFKSNWMPAKKKKKTGWTTKSVSKPLVKRKRSKAIDMSNNKNVATHVDYMLLNGFDCYGRKYAFVGMENKLQTNAAVFLDRNRFTKFDWWHTPNGGTRHKKEAANLKRQGAKSGVPDVIVARSFGQYIGLAIELKVKQSSGGYGKLSTAQIDRMRRLEKQQYYVCVAFNLESVVYIVENFFSSEQKL